MKSKISVLMASLFLVVSQAIAPSQASEQLRTSEARATTRTTTTRTYNYNWQANIVNKHPNAKQFYWTPMTVTKAKTVKSYAPARARSAYSNRKPTIVAWNAYSRSPKQTSSRVNSEITNLQCTPTLSYGTTNASLYGSSALSGQLNSKQVGARIYSKVIK